MRKNLQEINKNSWQTTFVSDNLGKIKAGVQVVKSNCSTCWKGENLGLNGFEVLTDMTNGTCEEQLMIYLCPCGAGSLTCCLNLFYWRLLFFSFLSWRHPTPCRHSFCIWRWNCFTQPWIAGIHLIVTTNFKMHLFKFRNLDTKIILKIWFNLLVTEKMVWPGTHQPSVRKSKLVYNSKYSIPVHLFGH